MLSSPVDFGNLKITERQGSPLYINMCGLMNDNSQVSVCFSDRGLNLAKSRMGNAIVYTIHTHTLYEAQFKMWYPRVIILFAFV